MSEQEVNVKQDVSVGNDESYRQVLEECESVRTETETNARQEVLSGNWYIGKVITDYYGDVERDDGEGNRIVENLSVDLGMTPKHIRRCIRFFALFQGNDFDEVKSQLPEGKNLSWQRVVRKYLGIEQSEPSEEEDEEKKELGGLKKHFKTRDVLSAFRQWFIDRGYTDERELEGALSDFRNALAEFQGKRKGK